MELLYTVTKEDYITVLKQQLEQRQKRILSRVAFFLFTAGQTSLFLYCAFSDMFETLNLLGLGVLSLALTALSILNRYRLQGRAETYLKQFIHLGKISDQFWKQHHLILEKGSISINMGSYHNRCGCRNVAAKNNGVNAWLIYQGKDIFDIVPHSAFLNAEQCATFGDFLKDAAFEQTLAENRELHQNLPKDSPYILHYGYRREEYMRDQVQAYRGLYKTKLAWSPISIFLSLASTAVLLIVAIIGKLILLPAAILILLILNFHHIRLLTPLIKRKINSEINDLLRYYPDRNVTAYIAKDRIVINGSIYCMEFMYHQIKALLRLPHAIAIYMGSSLLLTIPSTNEYTDEEFSDIILYIKKQSVHIKDGMLC